MQRARQRLSESLLRRGFVLGERDGLGRDRGARAGAWRERVSGTGLPEAAARTVMGHHVAGVRREGPSKASPGREVASLAATERRGAVVNALGRVKGGGRRHGALPGLRGRPLLALPFGARLRLVGGPGPPVFCFNKN